LRNLRKILPEEPCDSRRSLGVGNFNAPESGPQGLPEMNQQEA
jgi:hypothetical protein